LGEKGRFTFSGSIAGILSDCVPQQYDRIVAFLAAEVISPDRHVVPVDDVSDAKIRELAIVPVADLRQVRNRLFNAAAEGPEPLPSMPWQEAQ
jgi:hypothetical protein